jgi:superkiller protein 3
MKRAAAFALVLAAACNTDASAPHLARGNVLVNNGRREEAAKEYREAARLAPRSALARERLGDTLYDLGRKDEALAAYHEAAALERASSFTARIGAARVLEDKGDLKGARAELSAALEQEPTNLFLLLSRGNLARRAGDGKAALADAERAVHLKSDNVPALYQYGLALLDDGQVPQAGATFDRLLKVSSNSPEGYYGRARYFAARGEGALAAEALAKAAKLVESDARARLEEQGLKGEALDKAAHAAAGRSLASMQQDPAFARWARDPGFRRGATWPISDAR